MQNSSEETNMNEKKTIPARTSAPQIVNFNINVQNLTIQSHILDSANIASSQHNNEETKQLQ